MFRCISHYAREWEKKIEEETNLAEKFDLEKKKLHIRRTRFDGGAVVGIVAVVIVSSFPPSLSFHSNHPLQHVSQHNYWTFKCICIIRITYDSLLLLCDLIDWCTIVDSIAAPRRKMKFVHLNQVPYVDLAWIFFAWIPLISQMKY